VFTTVLGTSPSPRRRLVSACYCVIYLPRPFSPPILSERGLCFAAESYRPLSERRRRQPVCVCGNNREQSGLRQARGRRGEGGMERRRRKRHRYEYSSRVGDVVRCILTNQGVNMTLAQTPTVHRVRERN